MVIGVHAKQAVLVHRCWEDHNEEEGKVVMVIKARRDRDEKRAQVDLM